MKTLTFCLLLAVLPITLAAQQTGSTESLPTSTWKKMVDEVTYGQEKIKYSAISGTPYHHTAFEKARVADTNSSLPIRYNIFMDTVEVLAGKEIYELPRDEAYPKFTFEKTGEKLVIANTNDEYAGYFFEIVSGDNRLLKKVSAKYKEAVPPANSFSTGRPERFEPAKPVYYIRTQKGIVKIPKNNRELASLFPDQADKLTSFIKNNKIKLTEEADLIKTVNFMNN